MMRTTKILVSLALGCVLSAGRVSAQSADALPFVRTDRDPRSVSLGFAGTASAQSPAYASFGNSALIPFFPGKGATSFSFQNWAPGAARSSNFNLGTAFKAGRRLGFSLGGAFQSGEAYEVNDQNGIPRGSFSPSDLVVNGGFGVLLADFISVGINARYASEAISEDDKYSAFCSDAFVMCAFGDFKLALGVSSLGTPVKSAVGEDFSLPTSATFGFDWLSSFSETHSIDLVLDADLFLNGGGSIAVGAEYGFDKLLFLRAGSHTSFGQAVLPSFLSCGLGLNLSGITLDAGVILCDEALGKTLVLGLGYSF